MIPDDAAGRSSCRGGRSDRRRGARYPVVPAAIPSWAKNYGNGQIPLDKMIKVAPIGAGYLLPQAATAWRNLQGAANAAGFTLTMTGAYRTLDQQVSLFGARYVTENTQRSTKTWNNVRYWLKPGAAMAAVPGTSNHGWGCAVDAALDGYGSAARAVGEPFLSWAVQHAGRYGWSWEVQSEAWHLRLVALDAIDATEQATTAAVTRQIENTAQPKEETMATAILQVPGRNAQFIGQGPLPGRWLRPLPACHLVRARSGEQPVPRRPRRRCRHTGADGHAGDRAARPRARRLLSAGHRGLDARLDRRRLRPRRRPPLIAHRPLHCGAPVSVDAVRADPGRPTRAPLGRAA